MLNALSDVAFKKTSPTIEYRNGAINVATPEHFLDLMGVTRFYPLGSTAANLLEEIPSFTPAWAKVMSRDDFVRVIEDRKVKITAAFAEVIPPGGSTVLESRRSLAEEACDKAIEKLKGMTEFQAAYCLVLEGMFASSGVDLAYVGTVAEIENQIPQLGLVFNRGMGFQAAVTNLGIDLSPALLKIAGGTAAAGLVALALGGSLAAAIVVGIGVVFFGVVHEIDAEERVQTEIPPAALPSLPT